MNAEILCAEALKAIGSTQSDYAYVIYYHYTLSLQICLYDAIHVARIC